MNIFDRNYLVCMQVKMVSVARSTGNYAFFAVIFIFASFLFKPAHADVLDGVVPEIYLPSKSFDGCLLLVKFNGDYNDNRNSILNFLRRSFVKTNRWTEGFLIGGVDFISFSSFVLIDEEGCKGVAEEEESVLSRLKDSCIGSSNYCDSLSIFVKILDDTKYLSFDQSDLNVSPIERAEKYLGRDRIAECSIRVEYHLPKEKDPLKEFRVLSDSFNSLRIKYRMPIADVFMGGGSLYLLYSRDCEKKDLMYKTGISLMEADGTPVLSYLGQPDFNPDVSDYRFSEAGGRFEDR